MPGIFSEFYCDSEGDCPFDQQVLHTVAGTEVTPAARQAYVKCTFLDRIGGGVYNMAGIQDLLIRVEYKPRDARFR